ncbi:MAG: sugar phosphate nucleotidyltransferase [Chthoniobacterales bacterium]
MESITQAFILGAGLGMRMRPLTEQLPKPLVPIFQKALITFAFDHLIDAGCTKLIVNTHHRPEAFGPAEEVPYRGIPVRYRWEPILLETGGGIANVADLLGDEPFLVYNGDILTDLPIQPLIDEHLRAGNVVTLALRSGGGPQDIAFDHAKRRIIDIRNQLQTGAPEEYLFTGIYAVNTEFLRWLEPGAKRSVIPTFLEMIRRGAKLGGIVLDQGAWWDVGTRAAYLQVHRELPALEFPSYSVDDAGWRAPVHPLAVIETGAELRGCSVAGAGARVGAGAMLEDTIIWRGAQIASRSHLRNCIVRSQQRAEGEFNDIDI